MFDFWPLFGAYVDVYDNQRAMRTYSNPPELSYERAGRKTEDRVFATGT